MSSRLLKMYRSAMGSAFTLIPMQFGTWPRNGRICNKVENPFDGCEGFLPSAHRATHDPEQILLCAVTTPVVSSCCKFLPQCPLPQ